MSVVGYSDSDSDSEGEIAVKSQLNGGARAKRSRADVQNGHTTQKVARLNEPPAMVYNRFSKTPLKIHKGPTPWTKLPVADHLETVFFYYQIIPDATLLGSIETVIESAKHTIIDDFGIPESHLGIVNLANNSVTLGVEPLHISACHNIRLKAQQVAHLVQGLRQHPSLRRLQFPLQLEFIPMAKFYRGEEKHSFFLTLQLSPASIDLLEPSVDLINRMRNDNATYCATNLHFSIAKFALASAARDHAGDLTTLQLPPAPLATNVSVNSLMLTKGRALVDVLPLSPNNNRVDTVAGPRANDSKKLQKEKKKKREARRAISKARQFSTIGPV